MRTLPGYHSETLILIPGSLTMSQITRLKVMRIGEPVVMSLEYILLSGWNFAGKESDECQVCRFSTLQNTKFSWLDDQGCRVLPS